MMRSPKLCLLPLLLLALMGAAGQVSTVPSFDGAPIVYEVHGDGEPTLVFVHGWSCDRGYWDGQVEPFARDHRVVTLDLAGHGESGSARESWSVAAFGEDIAAVVEEVDASGVVLIGHSLGGDAIVEAARRLPGRVAGLVWADDYKRLGEPYRTPAQVDAFIASLSGDFRTSAADFVRGMFAPGADEDLVERVATDMASAPPEIALAVLRSGLTYDREVTVALEELDVPVVAINPDDSPTDMESMQRYGVEVVIMPGAGHFLMMDDPEAFNRHLRGVINGLTG